MRQDIKLGIFWKIFSCFCYAAGNLIIRYLTGGTEKVSVDFSQITPFQVAWLQNFVGCIIVIPTVLKKKAAGLKTAYPLMHFFRIITAALGVLLFYSSLKLMPIVESVAFLFTAPVFTVLICSIFLKEKINLYRLISIVFALIGILIVSETKALWPTWNDTAVWRIVLPFGATLSFVICKIIGKQLLLKGETAHLLTTYLVMGMALVQLIPGLSHWVWPTFHQWLYLLILGFFTWFAHYALSKSYCYADVVFLMPFGFSRILLTVLLSYLIFEEAVPSKTFWYGSAILFLSSFIITLQEVRKREKQETELSTD